MIVVLKRWCFLPPCCSQPMQVLQRSNARVTGLARGCSQPTLTDQLRLDMAVCGFCQCGCGTRTRRKLTSGEFNAHQKKVWNGFGAAARHSLRKSHMKMPALQAKVILDARLALLRHHNQRLISGNQKLHKQIIELQEKCATLEIENEKLLQHVTITRRSRNPCRWSRNLDVSLACKQCYPCFGQPCFGRRKQMVLEDTAEWMKSNLREHRSMFTCVARRAKHALDISD
jgi:hypothetical protein